MEIYKYYNSRQTDVVVIDKKNKRISGKNVGNIRTIKLNNSHTTATTRVRLYIDDGTNEYDLLLTNIPPMTGMILDDNLGYNGGKFDLKITLSEAGYAMHLIIK